MKGTFLRESDNKNLLNALIQGTFKAPSQAGAPRWVAAVPALLGGSWDLSLPLRQGFVPSVFPLSALKIDYKSTDFSWVHFKCQPLRVGED